jgi:hypothetical protein
VAHELGHDIGEAHRLLARAAAVRETGEVARHEQVLRDAVAALEPLCGVWSRAYDAHRDAVVELRSLDPTYRPRELQAFRFESGLTVNDRTNPAVDHLLRLYEAQFEHESLWRGEPALTVPDGDVTSVAHSAVAWGYLHRLYGTGAEFGVRPGECRAPRLARVTGRGSEPAPAPHLGRAAAFPVGSALCDASPRDLTRTALRR